MTKAIARYAVMFGLSGCYMPTSHSGPYVFDRRKDLLTFIRDQLAWYDFPASRIRDLDATRLWQRIKAHGSSVQHFGFEHNGHSLEFQGLTEAEAAEMEAQDEFA